VANLVQICRFRAPRSKDIYLIHTAFLARHLYNIYDMPWFNFPASAVLGRVYGNLPMETSSRRNAKDAQNFRFCRSGARVAVSLILCVAERAMRVCCVAGAETAVVAVRQSFVTE
jgi:hypothetical protein